MKLPAGIRQRGNSLFIDVTVKGIRKTGTVTINGAGLDGAIAEALTKQAALKVELMQVIGIQAEQEKTGGWTLKQAFERTKKEPGRNGKSWLDGAKSGEKLIRNAELVVEHFGAATLMDHITKEKIDGYKEKLKADGNSGPTTNRKLAALSRMVTVALENGGMSKQPLIKRLSENKCRLRWLTRREEETGLEILSQWGKDDHAEVFCILVDSGLRPSELYRLTAQDCGFDLGKQGRLIVQDSKSDEKRMVPMTARVSEILHRRCEVTKPGQPLYPYSIEWFGHVWDRMKAHMKLEADKQFIPYALRRTFASRLVQLGVPLKTVQELLGHKNITMTQKYAFLAPSNLDDAVRRLEDI